MSNSTDIRWIQKEIENLDDPALLELIKKLLLYRSNNEQAALKKALDEAFDDLKNGRMTGHEDVRKKYEKWL
ncbi:MAG: hypothetical protein WBG42_15885 [Cryomorphaceae bacterium]